jgi:hypothetical protein
MKPKIHLALTHDWELRGDGSGDIEEIQFSPLRRLLEIYERARARTTFMPDIMQQLRFRQLQSDHPELQSLADKWDERVREAFRQGHDVQLHLHPQWLNGEYKNGQWRLSGDWSIAKYDRDAARSMLTEAKSYLDRLLQPVDPEYRCVAFRAGALAAAPSDHLFENLASLGLGLDVSIAPGLVADDHDLGLDYRNCDEDFLPFYPNLKDARKLSGQPGPIVCVPLNHFYGSRRAVTRQNLSLARKRIANRSSASAYESGGVPAKSKVALAFEKVIKPAVKRKYFVSDTGRLDYPLMKEMLASIRRRADKTGLNEVPVVVTNHPKDIRDWKGLERFVGELAQADDIKFITLSEIALGVKQGRFKVIS